MSELIAGDVLAARELRTMHGDPIRIPDPTRLTHLMLRGRSGSRHLWCAAERHVDILAAGVREVAVLHSSPARLRRRFPGLPFPVVPDPRGGLAAECGVPVSRTVLGGRPADLLLRPDGRLVAVRYGRSADDHWSIEDLLRLAGSAR